MYFAQNPRRPYVNSSIVPMAWNANKVQPVHFDTFVVTAQLCANIGCVACAKKATNANFCTNTT